MGYQGLPVGAGGLGNATSEGRGNFLKSTQDGVEGGFTRSSAAHLGMRVEIWIWRSRRRGRDLYSAYLVPLSGGKILY